ncbi:MAG: LysR family transcriptional regulator, partial [Hyphomicrobiales bacterium]|nr:LysR family transcriptional regulator [Hyphomicrobiales bacterium]
MGELDDVQAFFGVVRAGGFREAAREGGTSASRLSEAVRRLEARLDVRLLHRTTRSVAATEAGRRLMSRLVPALAEVEGALDEAGTLAHEPAGTLRLNVPESAARLVLARILPPFLAAHPRVVVEVTTQEA